MAESRQYLYRLSPMRPDMVKIGPTDEEAIILTQHFTYLKDLSRHGVVLIAGRTQNDDETTFGIVILRADSEQSALRIMKNDPAVKHDVMHAELYPFKVAMHTDAWDETA